MAQDNGDGHWSIDDQGQSRVLRYNDSAYETPYSESVIRKLIAYKGIDAAIQYVSFQEQRTAYLKPLFERLNQTKKGLRVLEVGCFVGHVTEWLCEQPSVDEVWCFDVDGTFVDIARQKISELGLKKVVRCDHFTNLQSADLPYPNDHFDVVIALAVAEHLPMVDRYRYIDGWYRKLKTGGVIGFFETPNRLFPVEVHSFRGVLYHWLPPGLGFPIARLFHKAVRRMDIAAFVRPGIGWRGPRYVDLVPRAVAIKVADVSTEYGYGFEFSRRMHRYGPVDWMFQIYYRVIKVLTRLMGVPVDFLMPVFNLIFEKQADYEALPKAAEAGTAANADEGAVGKQGKAGASDHAVL